MSTSMYVYGTTDLDWVPARSGATIEVDMQPCQLAMASEQAEEVAGAPRARAHVACRSRWELLCWSAAGGGPQRQQRTGGHGGEGRDLQPGGHLTGDAAELIAHSYHD
jgi:hypothetical protein